MQVTMRLVIFFLNNLIINNIQLFSFQMSYKSQRNFPIYDKELLAIKVALEEWRHYLEGARH